MALALEEKRIQGPGPRQVVATASAPHHPGKGEGLPAVSPGPPERALAEQQEV